MLGNPHVQTVLGSLLSGREARVPARRHHVTLPDGDGIVLHDTGPATWHHGDPIVLMVHGLGSSHRAGYMIRLTKMLKAHGVRVALMDMRGIGAGTKLARRTYNAACSDDVRGAAEYLHRVAPHSPLYLAGFSLGGNIVLKLAGEAGQRPLPNLKGVAAVAPPIDLETCCVLLAQQQFYDRFFARDLMLDLQRLQSVKPDLPRVNFPS